ncbi:hypothetical protein MRX96_022618 [Rhipicephalus microplus]
MTPILFNLVVDEFLAEHCKEQIAFVPAADSGDLNVSGMAFADDLIIFASTPAGLQDKLLSLQVFRRKRGLSLNSSKFLSLAMIPVGKKLVKIDPTVKFYVNNEAIPAAVEKPHYKTGSGVEITDFVLKRDDQALVLDAQVVKCAETSDSTIDARDDDADHDDNELMDEEVALAWADLQESDVPANVHISEFMQADYCLAVILSRTIENHNNIRSVATKVAIQLNCKLGGEAWCLPMLLSNTIVIGYDTYHNAGSRNRTVGAFVASMNQTFTRWYSRVSFPSTHEQLGIMLTLHLRDCLSKYAQANLGAFPERIIIFRDGEDTPCRFGSGDAVWAQNFKDGEKWLQGTVKQLNGAHMMTIETLAGLLQRHMNQVSLRDSPVAATSQTVAGSSP